MLNNSNDAFDIDDKDQKKEQSIIKGCWKTK